MQSIIELVIVTLFNILALSQLRASTWRGIILMLLCIPINTIYGFTYAAAATPGDSRWVEGFMIATLGCVYLVIIFWTIFLAGQRHKPPFKKG